MVFPSPERHHWSSIGLLNGDFEQICDPAHTGDILEERNDTEADAEADLQAVDAGRGDVPLIHLRFRCTNCGSWLTGWVITSRDQVRPW
jgi:hypothetical protein